MVTTRRLTVAATFTVTMLVTVAIAYVLLKDTRLAIAGGVGIFGLTVMFLQPFVGLVNYLLFVFIRPQDYVHALTGMHVMLVLGGATSFIVLLNMALIKRSIALARSPNNILLLWFTIAIVASELATLVPGAVWNAIAEFGPTVILYLLVANLVTTERRLRFVVNFMVILTMVLAFQGVVQLHTGHGLGGQDTYEGRIRAIGIFADPNDLAMAMVMVQPLLLLKLLRPTRPTDKMLALIAMAVLTYGIVLTQSRGGLLAFGMLMMIALKRRLGNKIGLSMGAFLLVAIVVLSPRMSTISAEEGSTYGRIEAWTRGLYLFQHHPLLGVGFGNFTEYHFRTAHNSLVLCAAELGIVGLFAWVMMLYVSVKNLGYIVRELKGAGRADSAMYVEAIRLSFFSYMVAAYFLSRTYNELLFIILGLTTAITHMFLQASGERYVLIERRDFAHAFVWMLGGLVFTKIFLFTAW